MGRQRKDIMFKQGRAIGWHQTALGVADPTAQAAERCSRHSWVCAQSWQGRRCRGRVQQDSMQMARMAVNILSSQGVVHAAFFVKWGDNNTCSMSQELEEKDTTPRPDPKSPECSSPNCPGSTQVPGPSCRWMGVGERRLHPSGMSTVYRTACALMRLSWRPSFLQFLHPIYRASSPMRTSTSREAHTCLLGCPFSKYESFCPFEGKI